jgi:hypothetical protein
MYHSSTIIRTSCLTNYNFSYFKPRKYPSFLAVYILLMIPLVIWKLENGRFIYCTWIKMSFDDDNGDDSTMIYRIEVGTPPPPPPHTWYNNYPRKKRQPVTVVARSKEWTLFARSDAVIVGSNPTQVMDISCVYAFILCLVSDLAMGWSLAQGVLPSVENDYGTEWAGSAIVKKEKEGDGSGV